MIHIPKPGENLKSPSNHRPISLTSCVCKTMERMINTRLVWFLEKNNILTIQSINVVLEKVKLQQTN